MQSHFIQPELDRSLDNTQSIGHAPLKINRRGFSRVPRRAGHLSNTEPKIDNLGQHLIVENKIVAVFL
jgi:hypothetical protein